ncbi:MAG TPA: GNAT family N-acetyltransferase [Gaiellaceae bacterium]|nr:GNAT family N-acetyltransferase [Gaiellaceae bacterium]
MQVRRARPGDAAAIAEVHVRAWQAAYEHVFGAERLAELDVGRRRTGWERILAAPDEQVLVAEHEGEVVAFASVGPSRGAADEGELYAVYALPSAWGSGAGPKLMRESLAALRELGYRAATLWVLEDNPRARRFYEREGWCLDGARREGEHLGVATAEVRYRIGL